MNKTAAVFGVLMYLMVCAIGSVLISMVPGKPQVTALAIALMSRAAGLGDRGCRAAWFLLLLNGSPARQIGLSP